MNNLNFNRLCNLLSKPAAEVDDEIKQDMARLKAIRLTKVQKRAFNILAFDSAHRTV